MDSSCLLNWSIEWLLGILIELFFISYLFYRTIDIFIGIYTAKQLLKKNRGKPGLGYGTQAADLFMEIWMEDKFYETQHIEHLGNGSHTQPKGLIAANYLVPRKLVEIYQHPQTGKYPVF